MNHTPLKDKLAEAKKYRLGIVQRVLTPYRVTFFEKLALSPNYRIDLCAGKPMAGETIKVGDKIIGIRQYESGNQYILRTNNMLVWQTNMLRWLQEYDPDVLVMEANPRILSHWQAFHWMHNRHRPVLGWGLGELNRTGAALSLKLRRTIAQKFARTFDGIIAYSTKAKSDYVAAGVAPERIFVAYNSTDNSEAEYFMTRLSEYDWVSQWCNEIGLDPKLPIVLSVGRLIASKQIDSLIHACTSIFPRCQLLIVGDGPDRSRLEKLAASHKDCVFFLGHQTGEVLAQAFVGSSVFVLPGAGGLALHQAMSYGKPVIASFGDGTEADLIREGHNGFSFRLGNVNDLIDKIQQILFTPGRIQEMGRNSLMIVRNEINLDIMAANFMQAVEHTQTLMR